MKKKFRNQVEQIEMSKKANPLDLSSDQDLTIALMNLVAIEESAAGSQVGQMASDIRKKLMQPMIAKAEHNGKTSDAIYELLVQAVNHMQDAMRAQAAGQNKVAYELFNQSYESYVMYLATIYGISA